MAPRKVVLAVDSSPVSLDAVKWTTKSLCAKDDELHLISVLESGKSNEVPGESAPDDAGECKPDPTALLRTQDLLKQCKEDAAGAGIKNVRLTTLVSCVGGSTNMARHIVDYSDSEGADMLVLGSRGMGGFKRAFYGMVGLGSVSDYVTKNAKCNVVVHKMPAA